MLERKLFFIPKSIDELSSYLKSEGLPISSWGIGGAKTVEHLFKELSKGESFLSRKPEGLVRKVLVVNVRVYFRKSDGILYLREQKQVFNDGRERNRNWFTWSISEKMNPNENKIKAVKRAFQEELGITGKISLSTRETSIEKIESPSYPGLKSEYESHFFDAFLSHGQFNPEGYIEIQEDKRTYWQWEKIS